MFLKERTGDIAPKTQIINPIPTQENQTQNKFFQKSQRKTLNLAY